MKVYFAAIENISDMQQKAELLMNNLSNGNMEDVRALEHELVVSSDSVGAAYLTDDEWKSSIQTIRSFYPDFQADIVLDNDTVIRLNQKISDLPQCIHAVIQLAFEKKSGILELPMEDESDE